jgi:hypothetical protein
MATLRRRLLFQLVTNQRLEQQVRRSPTLQQRAYAAWLAIDLSHIGLDVSVDACRRHLAAIVEALPAGRRIQVGAEDTSRTGPILEIVTALVAQGAPLMATVQANLRRSPQDLARLAAAGDGNALGHPTGHVRPTGSVRVWPSHGRQFDPKPQPGLAIR